MMTDFADLANIISTNWDPSFKAIIGDLERIKSLLHELEVPRNTIAHCNPLTSDEKTRFLQNVKITLGIAHS